MATEVKGRNEVSGRTRGGEASRAGDAAAATSPVPSRPGFLVRYRLPLLLAAVALCLYVGSILYILYGRGQIA